MFESTLEEVQDWGNASTSKATFELVGQNLNGQLNSLTNQWETLKVVLSEDEEKLKSFGREFRQCHRSCQKTLQCVLDRVASLTVSTIQTPPANPTVVTTLPTPKLPAIKIPSFDGKLENWSSFWDIFDSLVHSRTDLTDVVKFATLRNYLTDRAFRSIEGLAVTNSNYAIAIKTLKDCFHNTDKLLSRLIRELNDLPVPRHSHDELLDFKLSYEKLLAQINHLERQDTSTRLFREIIIKKLPSKTFKILANKYNAYHFSCDSSNARKLNNSSQSQSKQKQNPASKNASSQNNQNSFQSNRCSSQNTQANIAKSCIFCEQSHSSKYGVRYPSLQSRRERVRSLNLCFCCLKKGHRVSDCQVKFECRNCNGNNHHTFLCAKSCDNTVANPSQYASTNIVNLTPLNTAAADNTGSLTNFNPAHPPPPLPRDGSNPMVSVANSASPTVTTTTSSVSVASFTNSCSGNTASSLSITALPTAFVQILGGGYWVPTRTFFDTGSQRTFIQSDLAKQLNLPIVDRITLSLTPFASQPVEIVCNIVKVVIRFGKSRITLKAVAFDKVNTVIRTPGLINVVNCLKSKGIKLADGQLTSDDVTQIGLVIGAEIIISLEWVKANVLELICLLVLVVQLFLVPYLNGQLKTIDLLRKSVSQYLVIIFHTMEKDSATTPLRIVLNASSKQTVSDPSLNDCLLTGPSLTAKLFDYLLVFRTNPFAVVSDISKAFFCKTIVYHLEHNSDPLASQLIPHFYVDNFCKTNSCLDSMLKEYPRINQILLEANMPLQSWRSNSVKFNEVINLDVTEVEINVLGINWNVTHDSLSIKSSQVKDIRDGEFPSKYVPTKENPANLVTRGVSPSKLQNSGLWLCGPTWLDSPSKYPIQREFDPTLVNEILVEPVQTEPIIPCLNLSKYSLLFRALKIVRRIIQFCKKLMPNKPIFCLDPLTVLVRMEQQFHYPTLIKYLPTASFINVPQDITNFANQLGLHLNSNGVVCSKGRLQNSELPSSTQTPMLLPPKSHLTMLKIRHYHINHHHSSVNTVLVLLRETFWLPKARKTIKYLLAKCVLCRKLRAQTFPVLNPPPLPSEQVTFTRPFDCIGVNFTGAYNVYDVSSKSLNDIPSKAYICLFTCTSSRAIHLELVRTLSTVDFLLALRRFCAFYSTPRVIISDNGSNFQGCNQFLQQIKDKPEVLAHLNHLSIQWKFITPRAPWFGRFYERLIGVVKGSLSKALYHKRVTFDELHTVLCEIKSIANNRPLTYISDSCKITRLIFGRDNIVRSVEVSVHGKLYERSISKIAPLEIRNPVLTEELNNDKSYEDFRLPEVPVPDVPLRPQRKAAKKAALNSKQLLIDGQL
ncbi:uncharacterized protein [Palaemon carinicauda]|uniref:uncharacterized protein n=1 Tax=Palaemon carinicauda TaxID=392227 RepID=UPI0035B63E13